MDLTPEQLEALNTRFEKTHPKIRRRRYVQAKVSLVCILDYGEEPRSDFAVIDLSKIMFERAKIIGVELIPTDDSLPFGNIESFK